MIKNVADLLKSIVEKHRPLLDAEPVKHGPTIGDMYEGLTAHLLERGLPFSGIDLQVVTGFAEGDAGVLSPQMDCMIVVGEGREVPFTQHRVYPLDRVIAVIEVKKTLYADDLSDAYGKCSKVSALRPKAGRIQTSVVARNFRAATNRQPSAEPEEMPEPWRSVYGALLIEAVLPARIVLGYHGYKSLNEFRRAIVADVFERVGSQGSGPISFPTVIASDRFVVVKGDGIPYVSVIEDDFRWPLVVSSSEPPFLVILEVIWNRLCARYGELAGMFGEDLELASAHRLLDFKFHESAKGWEAFAYADADAEKRMAATPRVAAWEPARLTLGEFFVVNWLCKHDTVDVNEPIGGAPADEYRTAIEGLVTKRLIGSDPATPDTYELLTRELKTAITPDGEFIAAEDVDGRLTRWLDHRMRTRWRAGGGEGPSRP